MLNPPGSSLNVSIEYGGINSTMVHSHTTLVNSTQPTAKGKLWKFSDPGPLDKGLLSEADNSEILAALLKRRGICSTDEAKAFLKPECYKVTSPMELPDVAKAVVRINQAIELKEHITVFGDYDVDGVTGTSVLVTVLKALGASVDFYIPSRIQEGYGLNLKAISVLVSKHRTKLIITCDCGISNFAEVNFSRSLGADTLILDHHSIPELMPPAVGIVHPKLLTERHAPHHLPGVGIAYKVCEAVLVDRGLEDQIEPLLDFVTLGMIADLVPLVKENRYLVQVGLPRLINSQRPGIQALLNQVRKTDDTDLVGFGLAPRINAVGRLSDARVAVELLTTTDSALAYSLSCQLQTENARRQEICERVFNEARQMIDTQINLNTDRAIAIYKKGWHHGVVGIVASRLVEKYGRPVFIAELDKEENIVKGSARSIEGVDLYAVLKANEKLLLKWGGHKMAAGFAVSGEKADALCRALVETCNDVQVEGLQYPSLEIDLLVEGHQLSLALAREFFKLAPFGMGNRKPLLCLCGVVCESVRVLGKEAKHHRIMVKYPGSDLDLECVIWNSHGKVPGCGEVVDLVFTPEINKFNGRERLQLVLADWRSSSYDQESKLEENDTVSGSAMNQKILSLNMHAQAMASTSVSQSEPMAGSLKASVNDSARSLKATVSLARTWKDLRLHNNNAAILAKAKERFGDQISVFVEGPVLIRELSTVNRLTLTTKPNLILLQFPPDLRTFQEVVARSEAQSIYVAGTVSGAFTDALSFMKQLIGLIRFVVSKRDGKVAADELAVALATTKMAVALSLSMLKKLDVVDWYAEDGDIYVDIIGSPTNEVEDLAEARQLRETLAEIARFREWCAVAELKEVQQAVLPNQIGLISETTDHSFLGRKESTVLELKDAIEREGAR